MEIQVVKCIKLLVHTTDARVAEFEIGPESQGKAHHHSIVSEHCFCLSGRLQLKADGTVYLLDPGDSLEIGAGVSHQVSNSGKNSCRYLVVQYGGAYDFIAV